MSLYNAKTEGSSLRVTKFDSDLNPESSYLTTRSECSCPAGSRPKCRHREMYMALLEIADSGTFLDHETGDYVTAEEALGVDP